ncbi:hypothetical protein [Ureibacillus chungkukjangi]|uniref:Uncharacterized protein n=1 Tax=Ureibacillus chungkukjangi TaxID=1202712 RepID=A0A318U0F7_9BACL|nr:hypothetical protein [Ureibacillus chungkukjangi]PYF07885.1 hypothetical protein BJ095_10352 [Ureibacillus chungkukjangi]
MCKEQFEEILTEIRAELLLPLVDQLFDGRENRFVLSDLDEMLYEFQIRIEQRFGAEGNETNALIKCK